MVVVCVFVTSEGYALALHAVDEPDGVVGVADGAEHVLAAAADPATDGLVRHDAGLHPGRGGDQLPAAAVDQLLPLRRAAHAHLDGRVPALVRGVQQLLQRGAAALEGRGVRGGPAPAADPDEQLLHHVPGLHHLAAARPPLLRPRPAGNALDGHHHARPPPVLHAGHTRPHRAPPSPFSSSRAWPAPVYTRGGSSSRC
jgi:hypothetical protein